jgi:glucan phosphoethanolaminetransferase (alkaline phosphatase superfamily)
MERRAFLAAGAMTVFVLVFELAAFRTPYRDYLPDLLNNGVLWGVLRLAALLALIGLQFLFFWVSFTVGPAWRVAFAVCFGLIAFVQHGYVHATGGFISGHDFEVAAAEVPHWLPMASAHVRWLAAVPVALYAALLFVPRWPPLGRAWRRVALVLALTLFVHSAYALSLYAQGNEDAGLIYGPGPPLTSSQAFARAGTMFVWNKAATGFWRARFGGRAPLPALSDRTPARHIVLIVDESVRADHLSVNGYGRATTPWLDERQRTGALTNWGIASSTAPLSNDSVLTMLTGVSLLPDRARHTQTWPTVFQFAKSMNYRTHLFDGGAKGLRWGFSGEDRGAIDDLGTQERFGNDPETDFRMAAEVSRVLAEPAGQFIVVLKRGNHPPYAGNYPGSHSVWLPDEYHAGQTDNPDAAFVNEYDNAIRYNVDGFFQALARGGHLDRAAMLYTSDHGQRLLEPREPGLSRNVIFGEVAVPMLLIDGVSHQVDTTYRARHANVMATLLDLMDVPAAPRAGRYARSLVGATGAMLDERLVFAGDVFGIGPYTRQNFDELAAARQKP